jgi:hypothetical protein
MNRVPEDAEYDPLSDVDLDHVVEGDPGPALRHRKLIHEGVLLETAYFRQEGFSSAEKILGSWLWAAPLSVPSVILDPSGRLTAIQKTVATHSVEAEWVRKRCAGNYSEVKTRWISRMTGGATRNDRLLGNGRLACYYCLENFFLYKLGVQ